MRRGASVQGLDGQTIGTVEDVAASAFCLRLSNGDAKWVQTDAVYASGDWLVTLICYGSGVDRWLAN